MSDRPTPETDACIIERRKIHKSDGSVQLVELIDAEFARRLERDLAEAMELLTSEKITRNHIIKRSVEVEKERDEALFLLKAAQSALDAIHLEVGGWIKIMKENTD